jgi:hypothetical protein
MALQPRTLALNKITMFRFALLAPALFLFTSLRAQLVDEWLDTLQPVPYSCSISPTLDSITGDTLLTLSSPETYVIRNTHGYEAQLLVAIKVKEGYKVFVPCEYSSTREYSAEAIDFNGKGRPELLIRWSAFNGRGGWRDGWNETSSGMILCDLDTPSELFSIENTYEYSYWWNEYPTDSAGEIITTDTIIGGGGSSECERYSVHIEKKKITIQGDASCMRTDEETGEQTPMDSTVIVYTLKRTGLVRQK